MPRMERCWSVQILKYLYKTFGSVQQLSVGGGSGDIHPVFCVPALALAHSFGPALLTASRVPGCGNSVVYPLHGARSWE